MSCLKLKLEQIEELLLITRLKDPPNDLRKELLLNNALKKLKEALEKKQKRHKRKYRGIKMKIEEKKDYSSIPEEKIDTEDLLGLNNFFTDLKTISNSDMEGEKHAYFLLAHSFDLVKVGKYDPVVLMKKGLDLSIKGILEVDIELSTYPERDPLHPMDRDMRREPCCFYYELSSDICIKTEINSQAAILALSSNTPTDCIYTIQC
ncbi:UNVERIFIED_CONTAM: hypothetical protein NCL1_46547 [Trichonephila clavipes]